MEEGHVFSVAVAVQANILSCLYWGMLWIMCFTVCMHSVPCVINMPTCINEPRLM